MSEPKLKRLKKIIKRLIFYHFLKRQAAYFLRPRLGMLYQYDNAIPLNLPKGYEDKPALQHPPSISIVTPSFNQGHFIEKTIKSVLDQDYPHLEFIIQDGRSQDQTIDILKKYQSQLKHWESKKDSGQSHAINLGFQHATGEILAYLNSDDLLLPSTLAYVAHYFNQHPEVDVIYGHRVLIDENDQEIGRWILPKHNAKVLTWSDYIPQETLFWRRSIWEKTGAKIDESFKFAMDWDLLLRFQEAGAHFARLPRFLGAFRVHPQQKTSAQINVQGEVEMSRLRMRCHQTLTRPKELKRHIKWYLIKHLFLHGLFRLNLLKH